MMQSVYPGAVKPEVAIGALQHQIAHYELAVGLCTKDKMWDSRVEVIFSRMLGELKALQGAVDRAEHPSPELANRLIADCNLCIRALEAPGGSKEKADEVRGMRQVVEAKINGGMMEMSLTPGGVDSDKLLQQAKSRIKFLKSLSVLCRYDLDCTQDYKLHQVKLDSEADCLMSMERGWSAWWKPSLSATVPRIEACCEQISREAREMSTIDTHFLEGHVHASGLLVLALDGVQRMCSTYMKQYVTNADWLDMMRIAEHETLMRADKKAVDNFITITAKQLNGYHAGLGDLYRLSRKAQQWIAGVHEPEPANQ